MQSFMAEFLGTMLLILLGNGVVANVVLNQTKGNNSGWIVITFGWAIAVFVGVYVASHGSAAHLNPAVTAAMVALGKLPASEAGIYVIAQMLGAMLGATLVWVAYKQHYDATTDASSILATFSNAPAIRSTAHNVLSEVIGTFALVIGVLYMTKASSSLGTLDALPVGLLVLGIGLSLGGATGYAINPARDLAPRIMHAVLPIKNKGDSDWGYSWIPVVAPILGALLAAFLFKMLS